MSVTITWQTVLTAAAFITAIVTLIKYFGKGYKFVEAQGEQEKEIKAIKEEQQLLTYGVLACLKGLREQGCDGAVTEAIGKFEEHLNKRAHA